jgi:hypothetical protein
MIELKLKMQDTGRWLITDGLGNQVFAYTKELPSAVKRMVNDVAAQINNLVAKEPSRIEEELNAKRQ